MIYSQNISGKIFEILENGDSSPLIGANIIWEGTSIGTVSDNNGFYSISAPDSYPAVLNVSFIGYESHTKTINAWRKNYDVSLRASVKINQVDVRRNIETTNRSIRDSINLQTISAGELEKAACCNLSECFETNAAVDVVFADALLSCPSERAQYDFLRLAAFDPGFTFPVTAVFNLEPGLAFL